MRAHGLMVSGRMVLGKIVGPVSGTGPPEDVEVALARAVAKPVEAHINGFGATLFDGVIDNATGGVVVGLKRGWRLGVTQFGQGHANWANILGIEKEGTQFGLGGAGNDLAHGLTQDMDGAVGRRHRSSGGGRGTGPGAEEGVAGSAGPALGGRKI